MSSTEDGSNRFEEGLASKRPIFLIFLTLFMKICFLVYDIVTFIPFTFLSDASERVELSNRVKAQPVKKDDPASDWRHVDSKKGLLSNVYDGCDTLGDVWVKSVENYAEEPCMGSRQLLNGEETEKDGKKLMHLTFGRYIFETYEEIDDKISSIIAWFASNELKRGDHVVIFAETRAEWMQSAIACFKYGLPVITIIATLGEDIVAYALKESDAKMMFTSRNLLKKIIKALEECPRIYNIVYFQESHRIDGDDGFADSSLQETFEDNGKKLVKFDELLDYDLEPETKIDKVEADDLAVIMYTSGTTGTPKGVMLSHRNIIAAVSGQGNVVTVGPGDVLIGYLPLAHILECCVELFIFSQGAQIGYSSPQTLFDKAPKIKPGTKGDCAVLKPTLIAAVPAVLDKIVKAVSHELKNPFLREIFRICYQRKKGLHAKGYKSPIMDKLIFNRIRNLLGGNLRLVLSGGAPLSADTQSFVNTCLCCPVIQGYGLTETCGGGTLMDLNDLSTGYVGAPIRCCEIKLREWKDANYSPHNDTPQGEVLISGDNVALGYFKNEEKTKEDFIELDGKRYFSSGDIGEFRDDGSLKIIDRKKDLIKLNHGEYISLGTVEGALNENSAIENVCVHGESDKDFLIALVVPNKKELESLAKKNNIDGSWEDLCKDEKLSEILAKEIASSTKLNRGEMPKKLILCSEPWTSSNGFLTEAQKLKRKNIEKAFEKEIKKAYQSK